jgi:hypothetical protein
MIENPDKNKIISYKREYKRPITLYSIFASESSDILLSSSENVTLFFTKNNAIYIERYNRTKTIAVPLYDYKSNTYDLVVIDNSHIGYIKSIEGYVKTPIGEIILRYHTSGFDPLELKYKTGIYNFSKRKIMYEAESKNVYQNDDAKMAYKPFVLSEMELVRPMPCYT